MVLPLITPLASPRVLHISMGQSCNNRCRFCNEGCRGTSLRYGLSQIQEQLEAMHETGSVIFTAGEPTLNPLLPASIKAAVACGFRTVALITNGRRLKERRFCLSLLEAGLNDITVSLHGPNAVVHDGLTQRPGSFSQTVKALENLAVLRKKLVFALKVNCTLVKSNFRLLREIHMLTRAFGVDRTNFNMVEPWGAALDNFDDVVPCYREVVDVADHSGLDFLSPSCSLSRIPVCAGGFEWVQETFLLMVESHMTTYEPTLGKTKGPPCVACALKSKCPGVWQYYVDHYGWEEFKSVARPDEREGQVLRILTGASCNNHCIHCYDGPAALNRPFSATIDRQLRAGILDGYRKVELAGGEVLLMDEFSRLVHRTRDIGYQAVAVETNGRALCLIRIQRMLVETHPDEVVVRLNAGEARIHDEMARVPGAWAQTMQGMSCLRELGIPFRVRLRRHPRNLSTIEAAHRAAQTCGARSFQVVEAGA